MDGGAFACLHAYARIRAHTHACASTRTRTSHPAFAVFDEDAEGFDVEALLFFGGVDGGFVVGVEGLEHEEAVAVDFDFFEGGVVVADVDGHDGAADPFGAEFDDGDGAVVDHGFHAVAVDAQGDVAAVTGGCRRDFDPVVGVHGLDGFDGGAAGDGPEHGQAIAAVCGAWGGFAEEFGGGGVQGAGDGEEFGLADVVFTEFDFGDRRAGL